MAQSTDTAEFERLLALHEGAVRAHVMALVPNKHDAAEVFQETCVTLWQKFAEYEADSDFRAWACRVAYFKVLSLRKRQFRLPRLFSPESMELLDQELTAAAGTLDARSEALARCREKLAPQDRALLSSYYRIGATAKSVARGRKLSVHRIYRALRQIHDALFDCINKTLAEDSHA